MLMHKELVGVTETRPTRKGNWTRATYDSKRSNLPNVEGESGSCEAGRPDLRPEC